MTIKTTRNPRMSADERRASFLIAGVLEAASSSYQTLDLAAVAERAESSRPRILQLFQSTEGFRFAVLEYAVGATGPFLQDPETWTSARLAVIAQGLVARHPLCADLDEETKAAALATLAS